MLDLVKDLLMNITIVKISKMSQWLVLLHYPIPIHINSKYHTQTKIYNSNNSNNNIKVEKHYRRLTEKGGPLVHTYLLDWIQLICNWITFTGCFHTLLWSCCKFGLISIVNTKCPTNIIQTQKSIGSCT